MVKWIIILIGIIASLSGWLYIGLCDADKALATDKADKATVRADQETVKAIYLRMEKAQALKISNDREDRKEQQAINRQVQKQFQETQMLILKAIQDKK